MTIFYYLNTLMPAWADWHLYITSTLKIKPIIGHSLQQHALREESSQTNVILQYKLLASILSAVCSVIQQS